LGENTRYVRPTPRRNLEVKMMAALESYTHANPALLHLIKTSRELYQIPSDYSFRRREQFINQLPGASKLVYSLELSPGSFTKWGALHPLAAEFHPVVHRAVSPLELVFETDAADYESSRPEAYNIASFLESAGIPFQAYYSGNRSIHINVQYNAHNINDNLKTRVLAVMDETNNAALVDLRRFLFSWACKQLGHGGNRLESLDKNVTKAARHMIRACGSVHPKTGYLKTFMGYTARDVLTRIQPIRIAANKDEADFPPGLRVWELPDWLVAKWLQDYEARVEAQRTRGQIGLSCFAENGELDPKYASFCERLLHANLLDKRRRGVFVLAGYLKNRGLQEDEARKALIEWGSGCVPQDFILFTTTSVYRSGMTPGMPYIRDNFPELLTEAKHGKPS
jgi:hypothetical protein